MQNMLRPIVEAAGYRVIGDEDGGDADLVIAAQGDDVGEAARAIFLRSELEPAGRRTKASIVTTAPAADGLKSAVLGGASERASAGRHDRRRAGRAAGRGG
jgi:hypothetical protein